MRILLVDDEVELTDSLAQLFAREGYEVDVAYDGRGALALLETHSSVTDSPYDLIVLDWMLPHHSGLELCQRVRTACGATPVLFLTAKDTLDDRVEGLDAGADDYLVKPFELRELMARVRAQLRRSQSSPTTVPTPQRLQVEDLELDRDNRMAYRQGKAIALSEKEFQLLDYFMTHPGQLLGREQIYRHLWPDEEKPSSNVLAAQVKLLRRKLEGQKKRSRPLIQSVYGKGYRFGSQPAASE
ncbi:two-component system response regulator RppA [Synechococcus sp. PCC 7336]|uniref:two-component system response regulator RppA n=1 Tax=Synechococcus sp. PCC 7336 TaxID=195250 RepID=UPI00034D67F1|nr:two-component system response regulator RppA [Synechococcus sp. PCC 7336]